MQNPFDLPFSYRKTPANMLNIVDFRWRNKVLAQQVVDNGMFRILALVVALTGIIDT